MRIRLGSVRRLGFSLGSVLLLAMMVVLISVIVVSLATFQLSSAQESLAAKDSEMLADSAINMVMSQMEANPATWTPGTGLTFQPDPADSSRTGVVVFATSGSTPYSTNNLQPTSSPFVFATGWNGAAVPPGAARLIGIGTAQGLVRQVEAIVNRRGYGYGLGWGGTLAASPGLFVGGVGSLGQFDTISNTTPTPVETDVLTPTPLWLNLPASIAYVGAAVPSATVTVSGDLYYATTALSPCSPGSQVNGVIRQVSNLVLPSPTITGTAGILANEQALTTGSPSGTPTADPFPMAGCCAPCPAPPPQGFYTPGADISPPTLTLDHSVVYSNYRIDIAGPLVLNQSILYIHNHPNPSLTVSGGISGSGLIVADGAVTITMPAMSSPEPSTEIAILSEGPVTITGPASPSTAYFQGMLYSADTTFSGLTVSNTVLGGVFVSQGAVNLTNAPIWTIGSMGSTQFGPWNMSPAPMLGNPQPAPDQLWIKDTSATFAGGFNAGDQASIYNSITGAGMAAYNSLISGGVAPLATASLNANTAVVVDGLYYDPGRAHYMTTHPVVTYLDPSAGTPIPAASFEAVANSLGYTTEDYLSEMETAQSIAASEANWLLYNSGPYGTSPTPGFQVVGIDGVARTFALGALMNTVPGAPSPFPLNIVSWRVMH